MTLIVSANGDGEENGGRLSVYICLTGGEYKAGVALSWYCHQRPPRPAGRQQPPNYVLEYRCYGNKVGK